jgi:hypothetical protein
MLSFSALRSLGRRRMAGIVVLVGGLLVGSGLAAPSAAIETQAIRDRFPNAERIGIPDATGDDPGQGSLYPSEITVNGLPDRLYDVNVILRGFGHDNPDDVDLLLEAPNGETAIIMADAGGAAGVEGLTLTLDDEATAALPDGGTLQTGASYRPNDYGGSDEFPGQDNTGNIRLGTFDGINPNGTWSLYVVDDQDNNENGAIVNGWQLEIYYGEAPEAVEDRYTVRQDRTLRVPADEGVLANDNDGDPEPGVESDLRATLKREPKKGTITLRENGAFTYRPDEGERGRDTFSYTVRDDDGLTDTGRVTLKIEGRE